MAALYLITHAHTEQQPHVDATTWALSSVGQRQATILANQPFWPSVDRLLLSSEAKTRLTVADVLTTHKIPITVDARLDELKRGPDWVSNYAERVGHVFTHPHQSVGGWETAADALARFLAGIADLKTRYTTQTLALVGHGLTLSLYRAHLLGQPQVDLADWRKLSFAAVAQVDLETNRLVEDFVPVAGDSPRG